MRSHNYTTEELFDLIKERILSSEEPKDDLYSIIENSKNLGVEYLDDIELTDLCPECDGEKGGYSYATHSHSVDPTDGKETYHVCEKCKGEGFIAYEY